MLKLKFFVHCSGWSTGGYENTHYFETKKEAINQVKKWNEKIPGQVTIVSLEKVSMKDFAEDYIYA